MLGDRQRVQGQFDRARARRQARRSSIAGWSSPACPTTTPSTRSSAQRPGCHGAYCAARRMIVTPAVRAIVSAAAKASEASTARPLPHGPPARADRSAQGQREQAVQAAIREAPPSPRRSGVDPPAAARRDGCGRCASRPGQCRTVRHRADRARYCGPRTSSSPGSNVVASSGRSDSSGFSTLVVLRRGSAASRAQTSKTLAGRKTGGGTSTNPSERREPCPPRDDASVSG